jgi:biopolymer transport protein TolR
MRQRKLVNQINVVPYIDVMMVLLVIFMVTAPLVTPGVIELPSVGKSSQPPSMTVEIRLRSDASLMLVERTSVGPSERRMSSADLTAFIQSRLRDSDTPVVIAADKDVRYDAVMKVMDELQRANVRKVGLLVKPDGR